MSILQFLPRSEYVGNNSVKTYTFDFRIIEATQLRISVYNSLFVMQYQVRGDDNTHLASMVFNPLVDGGVVTLTANLPTGWHIVLEQMADAPTQPKKIGDSAKFTLSDFEKALDYLGVEIQTLSYRVERSIKLGPSYLDADPNAPVDTELPRSTTGGVLGFSDDGARVVVFPKSTFKGDKGDTGDVGPQGPQGIQGIQGPAGANGTNGTNVTAIYTENTDPTSGDGINGEIWINTITYNYFRKEAGVWNLKGNIKGPQGPQGIQGNVGPKGDTGATIFTDEGDPNNFGGPGIIYPGREGDLYINIEAGGSSDYYQYKSGLWDLRGQLQGLQGPQGDPGDPGLPGGLQLANQTDIANGSSEAVIVFPSSFGSADYVALVTLMNTVDADPIMFQFQIKEKTATGFKVRLNAPTDSANYKVLWGITPYAP